MLQTAALVQLAARAVWVCPVSARNLTYKTSYRPEFIYYWYALPLVLKRHALLPSTRHALRWTASSERAQTHNRTGAARRIAIERERDHEVHRASITYKWFSQPDATGPAGLLTTVGTHFYSTRKGVDSTTVHLDSESCLLYCTAREPHLFLAREMAHSVTVHNSHPH